MPSRVKWIALCLSAAILVVAWALTIEGYFVAPSILRRSDQGRAEAVASAHNASWENVSIRASDDVILRGWLFTPQNHRGRAVLLVHGGMGNRHEMLGRAEWFLQRGYSCLLIDQRGCGTSEGRVSWGVKEPGDIGTWATWLRDRTRAHSVFGHGLSRGSTTLLQSLAFRPPFAGVALEATGAGNIARPYQFLGDKMGVSMARARVLGSPLIEPSLWWIRVRYGFDMKNVQDGVTALRGSQIPALLIHGSDDQSAVLAGAERLRDANPQRTQLVVIHGAGHDWFGPHRPVVMKTVLAWFDTHARP